MPCSTTTCGRVRRRHSTLRIWTWTLLKICSGTVYREAVFRIRIHLIRIRIQHFRLNTDPDPFRIQGFDDQKLERENYSRIGSKTTIYCTYSYASKIHKKPSALKRKHPALQNIKFLNFFNFCRSFLPSWIRIRIRIRNPDTDPLTWLNPDPKHWLEAIQHIPHDVVR